MLDNSFQVSWPIFAAVIVVAYLIGAIPFGYLIGRCRGIDVRKCGSGNIGATNVTRAVGRWAGRLCFFCDFLKGALPPLAVLLCFGGRWHAELALAAALAALVGHMYPIYLKFKGGKGISTGAGAAAALAPYPLVIALAVWVAVFLAGRYVSLASIVAAVTLAVLTVIFGRTDIGPQVSQSLSVQIFFVAVAVLAIAKHSSNIRRLLNGTESRFERHRK